ncbi:MBL fold metallo-hydrolase [Melaminivora alkalimesophila]|uniref:Glyoxylase-like metal-dependent hydrolase (Beta-lactamase superfamily II) n=1 Tax=Melaminivora alkalimesophila TaxID=1165852 RepID=A0A317R9N1_9BURK|nr:MBL fold metallo-hydrolase [Melaminivora alkalimesophila]PWW44604.1 glyoxylase-like metal-dependent hydrolase (beta-lactamase superfamily II) [Melaminivora alkalimesophila]
MSEKKFASQADLEEKKISWEKLSDNAYAYTAEGDPNTGVIIGDDGVMIIDATATPVAAQGVIAKVREITDKPIKYVVLTHYHAVRVLGASGYRSEGLQEIIASRDTYDLIVERGQQDMDSEIGRFPRLFQAVESVPGLTWPTLTFEGEMAIWLGGLEVRIQQIGRGHTKGDAIVYIPSQNICFSGDLVEADAACYTGDAYLADWPQTLDRLAAMNFDKLVPGRGPALMTPAEVQKGLAYTRDFVSTLYRCAQEAVAQGMDLKATMAHTRRAMDPKFGHVFIYEHCLPFDVTRAHDEASGIRDPRIWTAERDQQMWHALQQG